MYPLYWCRQLALHLKTPKPEPNCCFRSLYIIHCLFSRCTFGMRSLKSCEIDQTLAFQHCKTIFWCNSVKHGINRSLVHYCMQKIKSLFNRNNVLEDLWGLETWASWLSIPQRGNSARCAKSSVPIQHALVKKDGGSAWSIAERSVFISILPTKLNSSHALLVRLTATNTPV